MRFCSPKNYRIFVREEEASSRDVPLSTEKMENRETKVVIQSGLRLKLTFEVFWKFSCLFWHPLLTSRSITLQCGRKRKSFVTHRWFKISLIELLDPRGYVMHSLCRNFCTENALCFPSKCASESSSILQWTKDTLARFERYQSLLSAIPAAISMKQIKKLSGLCKSIILPKSHWRR